MIPFSSKSCWCLKVKVCPSLSFLTKTKEERSKSYHCFATWRRRGGGRRSELNCITPSSKMSGGVLTIFSRYCSRDSTVASGSIFNMRPVRSIRAVSPGARSRRNRSLLVKIWWAQELSVKFVLQTSTTRFLKTHLIQSTRWLTCRLYEEPGVSYRCRGRRSIDSRTAISLRIKATAGRL